MGGNVARLLFLRHDVDGSEQRRGAEHSSGRSLEHFNALYVCHIHREIEGIVSRLRVADVYAIEEDCDLLEVSAADTDVGLRSNRTTLPHIHAGDVFQQIVNTLHWRTLNFLAVQYSYHSRRLTSGQRRT